MKSLEVLFTPAEFGALAGRDLSRTVCVVFDVLRATTTMITALHQGASSVIPVADIPEALALRAQRPEVLLAGERDGLRITGALTGGVEFDVGNSPREFTPERVVGRTIVMTTTNGTRALRACSHARRVLVAGFVNLAPVTSEVLAAGDVDVLVICSGTHEEASFEDTLGAGALCEAFWPHASGVRISDSSEIARQIYRQHAADLVGAMRHARNGRRLLALPALAGDVAVCLERDSIPLLAELGADGAVRRKK